MMTLEMMWRVYVSAAGWTVSVFGMALLMLCGVSALAAEAGDDEEIEENDAPREPRTPFRQERNSRPETRIDKSGAETPGARGEAETSEAPSWKPGRISCDGWVG